MMTHGMGFDKLIDSTGWNNQQHTDKMWIVKANVTELAQTTNLLVTDTYTSAWRHIPTPKCDQNENKKCKGVKGEGKIGNKNWKDQMLEEVEERKEWKGEKLQQGWNVNKGETKDKHDKDVTW